MPYRSTFNQVFSLEMAIALAIFGAVVLLLVLAMVRSRLRKRYPKPRAEWTLLEGSFVLAYLGMATFLVVLSLTANHHEQVAVGKPAVTVEVTGFQWCWRFQYPGRHVSVTGSCVNGAADQNLPTLVIPTGTPVELAVTSSDVVHEFWIPAFDDKTEAFPGHVNDIRLLISHPGRWIGRCSEFCGLLHSDMHFWVEAVSPASYRKWLAAAGAGGSTAPPALT